MILGIVSIHTEQQKPLVSKLYCSLGINWDYLRIKNFPGLQNKAMIGSLEKYDKNLSHGGIITEKNVEQLLN